MSETPPEDLDTTDPDGTWRFHDVVLDFVPYTELPYSMLLDKAELGDEAAEAELNRRAKEAVERDLEAIRRRRESVSPDEDTVE